MRVFLCLYTKLSQTWRNYQALHLPSYTSTPQRGSNRCCLIFTYSLTHFSVSLSLSLSLSLSSFVFSFFLLFLRGYAYMYISSLGDRVWPPNNGYTVLMWFYIDTYGKDILPHACESCSICCLACVVLCRSSVCVFCMISFTFLSHEVIELFTLVDHEKRPLARGYLQGRKLMYVSAKQSSETAQFAFEKGKHFSLSLSASLSLSVSLSLRSLVSHAHARAMVSSCYCSCETSFSIY